jgi:Icc protein
MKSGKPKEFVLGHISDLHISADRCDRSASRTALLLDYLLSCGVDHVVVTGDITASGSPGELALARSLFERFSLLRSDRLSIVIGNHDIFGGVRSVDDILHFPARLRRTDYRQKVEEFRRTFREAFEGCLFGSREDVFPFTKIAGQFALLGLNTIGHFSRIKNPFGSNGWVGNLQLKRAAMMLSSDLIGGLRKIVLMHHHFASSPAQLAGTLHGIWNVIEHETLRLRRKKQLARLFALGGVELVLHGHYHESISYRSKGFRFVNSGGAVVGRDPNLLRGHLIREREHGLEVNPIVCRDKQNNPGTIIHLISPQVENAA